MRRPYGDDPSQWVEVHEPVGAGRGTVAVIHGGFWKHQYDASLGEPLARDLAARGWTALNVEYRRVGGGGGFPETFDDVHAALGLAAGEGPLVTLGHSAGGHLATWAAARQRFARWAGGPRVTHVVSQAGVLDLTAGAREGLGSDAVARLVGAGPEDPVFDLVDPMRHLPLDVPVRVLHARDDEDVPFAQAERYVAAATAAGGDAELVEVTGGHFDLIRPGSPAWAAVVAVLEAVDA